MQNERLTYQTPTLGEEVLSPEQRAAERAELFDHFGWDTDAPPTPGRIADRLSDIESMWKHDANDARIELARLRESLDAWVFHKVELYLAR